MNEGGEGGGGERERERERERGELGVSKLLTTDIDHSSKGYHRQVAFRM